MNFKTVSRCQPLLIGSLCGWSIACDPAATPEFVGDPIIHFRGQVSGESSTIQEDSPEVAVMWLTCAEEDGDTCHIFSGGSPGAGIGVKEGPDVDFDSVDQCISTCENLPECSDYKARSPSPLEGVRHCAEFVECVDQCGGFVASHDVYNAPVVGASISQGTAIEGNFPTAFQLGIYQAPSEEAQEWIGFNWDIHKNNISNSKIALGLIIAKGSGEVNFDSDNGASGSILGVAESHVVIYAEQPIARASDMGLMLGLQEELPAGFHVMDYVLVDCPEPDLNSEVGTVRCGHIVTPSTGNLQTSIAVRVDALGQLHLPLVGRL